MSTPYMSEIRIMAFGYAPKNWAQCNGQLVPISQNPALFSLLGTNFGGDGMTTFGLPNLQGGTAIGQGNGYRIGASGGEAAHVLVAGETPVHTHQAYATPTAGSSPVPSGNYLGAADNTYGALNNTTPLSPNTIANAGGGLPHPNMQPYLVLNFCIALIGVYPTQN